MVKDLAMLIIVLMYHGLDSVEEPSEFTEKGDVIYVVDVNEFENQMQYLKKHKVPVVTLKSHFEDKPCLGRDSFHPPVILTFDDGHITNYTRAFPILRRLGLNAYFFITTDWIGKPYYMNEDMIKRLCSAGMIIGSHGKTHGFLSDMHDYEVNYELSASKIRLEKITGYRVTALSVPGGRIDERVKRLAFELGYTTIFHSEPNVNKLGSEAITMGRFPVRRNTTLNEFVRIVDGKPSLRESMRYKVLKAAKVVMGNANYQKLRDYIMS